MEDKKEPNEHQHALIRKLEQHKLKDRTNEGLAYQQLLAFIQGSPGAGKTFTATKLGEHLGKRILFTGTTHNAARELEGYTINEALRLGQNTSNYKKTGLKQDDIQHIVRLFENIDILVIDEISMMTPVTLARIDLHLKAVFNGQYPFGGLDVILIGDMWQFPPVENAFQDRAALYQAAVRVASGRTKRIPNKAYTEGAIQFMKFKMLILEGQERAEQEYDDWLSKLRDKDNAQPIDSEWLKRLKILEAKDFQQNKGKIDWTFTPTIVTGNYERREMIKHKMLQFGKKYEQPILTWICKMRNEHKLYTKPEPIIADYFKELRQYFVRGAEVVLTSRVHGLRKGTIGTYVGVAWEDPNDKLDWNILEPGQITEVKQPDYIIIEIITDPKKKITKLIPVKTQIISFEDKRATRERRKRNKKCKKAYRWMKQHPTEITISKTYHKTQGGTYESIILSFNPCTQPSKKIKNISITSLYVGLSRVHDFDGHRILPISKTDLLKLTQLKHDPLLKLFFNNYDVDGNWNYDKLEKLHKKDVMQLKLQFGLFDFDSMIGDDFTKDIWKPLDIQVKPRKIKYFKKCYKAVHSEGKRMLDKNDGKLRLKLLKESVQTKELLPESIKKMGLKTVRSHARRLGIKTAEKRAHELRAELTNIRAKYINIELEDDEDSDMDDIVDLVSENSQSDEYYETDDDEAAYEADSDENYETAIQSTDDETEEKTIELINNTDNTKQDVVMPDKSQTTRNNTGKLFYQYRITEQQLKHIDETNLKVRLLFGDNDKDYYRKVGTTRLRNGGQARIMGKYDRTYAFGIITTFYKYKKPSLENFKKLMNKQFEMVKDRLLLGYDIVIPTPTKQDIAANPGSYLSQSGTQLIYHNLGTGLAKLDIQYLLYIQNKIDQLKTYIGCNKIPIINHYNQNTNSKTINSHDESDDDIDIISNSIEDIEPSEHSSDQDVMNGIEYTATCGNYCNDQEMADFDSSDQSTVQDVENIEVVDNEMLITLRMLGNTNNQCACACHKSDKREPDDVEHCKKCLKPILQIFENVIENDSILQEEIDVQQID